MVMTGEGRVLKPAAVQPGGEQLRATTESDLLVVLAPEREQRARQVVDQEVRRQLRQLPVEPEGGPAVKTRSHLRPGGRVSPGRLRAGLDIRVLRRVIADYQETTRHDGIHPVSQVREPRREGAGERVTEHREPPEPGRLHYGHHVAGQIGDPVLAI